MADTCISFSDVCPDLLWLPYPSKTRDTVVPSMQKCILLCKWVLSVSIVYVMPQVNGQFQRILNKAHCAHCLHFISELFQTSQKFGQEKFLLCSGFGTCLLTDGNYCYTALGHIRISFCFCNEAQLIPRTFHHSGF